MVVDKIRKNSLGSCDSIIDQFIANVKKLQRTPVGLIIQIEQTLAEVEALTRAMQNTWLIGDGSSAFDDPPSRSPSETLP